MFFFYNFASLLKFTIPMRSNQSFSAGALFNHGNKSLIS